MKHDIILFIISYIFTITAIIYIVTHFLMYRPVALQKYKDKKKSKNNKKKCRVVERAYKTRLWQEFFWETPKKFLNISFVFFLLIFITINTRELFFIFIGLLILIFYIYFIYQSYLKYKIFPIEAKKRIEEFETPIRDGVRKAVSFPGDTVKQYLLGDELTSQDLHNIIIIEQVQDVKKIDYPPFIPDKDKAIISERKLSFVVFTNEFICAFVGASKFNLIKPDRKEEKDGCEEKLKGALGGTEQEHYYSKIEFGKFEENTFKIYYRDGREFELVTLAGKAPELKDKKAKVMAALKLKLRVTERQVLRKVDEYTKLEQLKILREDSKERDSEGKEEDNKE